MIVFNLNAFSEKNVCKDTKKLGIVKGFLIVLITG
jgi:hypothetical protein